MNHLIKILSAIIISSAMYAQEAPFEPFKAIIKDPVVDMSVRWPAPENPPASPESTHCRRAHQGLYNEIVECQWHDDEDAQIAYENIVYGYDEISGDPLNKFWVKKKHLARLQALINTQARRAIPDQEHNQNIVILTYPWNSLSIGTRLVHIPEQDTQDSYAVVLGDYEKQTSTVEYIPCKNALLEQSRTPEESRRLFVTILNQLLDRVEQENPGFVIPCVWGGSSFIDAHPQDDFYQQEGAWERLGSHQPYTGYDSSELVMRMAQIAGITFPWKNTATIGKNCTPLALNEPLLEGDIIWMPGLVIIISNIQKNEVITVRGYSTGFGSVHRFKLHECIQGITTCQDLQQAYNENASLQLLNKDGSIGATAVNFKIFKLV